MFKKNKLTGSLMFKKNKLTVQDYEFISRLSVYWGVDIQQIKIQEFFKKLPNLTIKQKPINIEKIQEWYLLLAAKGLKQKEIEMLIQNAVKAYVRTNVPWVFFEKLMGIYFEIL